MNNSLLLYILEQSCSSTAGDSFSAGSFACWFMDGASLVQCKGDGKIGDGWTKVRQCDSICYMNSIHEIVCE